MLTTTYIVLNYIAASGKKHSSITSQRTTAIYVHTKYTNTMAIPLLDG